MDQAVSNPLSKHFRQPKLYVSLPSRGQYYPNGAIIVPENKEFPVLPMTAKDELMFKTPDALLNGQATVSVIESCFPNIKDGWSVPSIDIDAILIAIRIATYGENMDIDLTIPNTNIERSFTIDLRSTLDGLTAYEYNNTLTYNKYTFELHPLDYRSFTQTAMRTFEEQRIFQTINNDDLNDMEKLERFTKSFSTLTDININQVSRTVRSIKYGDEETVTNQDFIAEFFENTDKEIFKAIIDHIDIQRKNFSVQAKKVTTSEEDREAGAPETFDVPITFDQTNFFG